MSAKDDIIAEQAKLIKFLQSRYEKDTGRKPVIPSSLGAFLGEKSIIGGPQIGDSEEEKKEERGFIRPKLDSLTPTPTSAAGSTPGAQKIKPSEILKKNTEMPGPDYSEMTFMEAIESLDLPKPDPTQRGRGGSMANKKKVIDFKPHHLI